MKELSIEEKAKRYDEAIEKARKLKDEYNDIEGCYPNQWLCEELFPELKESEDEMIVKVLLNFLENELKKHGNEEWDGGFHTTDVIAWLEKQGEITKEWSEMKVANIQTELQEMVDLKQKTEQCKQKPADKVEPKFKVGDKIIHKELGGDFIHNPHKIIQVDILDKKYRLEGGLVVHFSEQDDYELVKQKPAWSEEDEKMLQNILECLRNGWRKLPTDILKYESWLKSLKDRALPQSKQEWSEYDKMMFASIMNVPGLDEQQKEWLVTCSPQPKQEWSEEDINKIDTIIGYIASSAGEKLGVLLPCIDWLKSLKDRVQPQPKQEWNEEDENIRLRLIDYLYGESRLAKDREDGISWLKSLKDRVQPQTTWKPSDELLDVFIKNATDFFESNFNPLTDGGVIGAFDDKEKMIEEFKEYMKEEGFNEEWI